MTWQAAARAMIAGQGACVLVTVAGVRGSAPREPGAKMLVSRDGTEGSIGGGHLEHVAVETARRLLDAPEAPAVSTSSFALGPALGQCCGGGVDLAFERLSDDALPWLEDWERAARDGRPCLIVTPVTPVAGPKRILDREDVAAGALPAALRRAGERLLAEPDRGALLVADAPGAVCLLEHAFESVDEVQLFGAGHVGQALVRALAPLPFRVTWIDSRADIFPADLPANAFRRIATQPKFEVDRAGPGAFFLVMTHSHPLDLEICDRVLRRGDFRFLGLIGSETKRARFVGRLRARGHSDDAIAGLTCPIGVAGIAGKQPAVIATSVAAQLLSVAEAAGRRRTEGSATLLAEGRQFERA